MRPVMWTLIIASGLAALALSFNGLAGLATLMGIEPAPLFPISVDITTTAATIAWLAGEHASKSGRALALASITASVVGNAIFHFLELANGYALLASVVAAVPPIMLAAVVHLGALLATPPGPHQGCQEAGGAGEPAGEKLVTSEDVRQEPLPQPTPVTTEEDDLVTRVAAIRQAAREAGERPPGRDALAKELAVTPHQIRAALEEIARRGNQDAGDDHQEPRQIAR